MAVTANEVYANRMRCFRNHGIDSDHRRRHEAGTWVYDMQELGFNYRLSDLQCALGVSQLQQLPDWLERRQEIAEQYDGLLAGHQQFKPLVRREGVNHAFHLYVVKLTAARRRSAVFAAMRQQGIGVNVHYRPVYLHSYHREHLGLSEGLCPQAEDCYGKILSLPMHPGLTDQDVKRVVECLVQAYDEAC